MTHWCQGSRYLRRHDTVTRLWFKHISFHSQRTALRLYQLLLHTPFIQWKHSFHLKAVDSLAGTWVGVRSLLEYTGSWWSWYQDGEICLATLLPRCGIATEIWCHHWPFMKGIYWSAERTSDTESVSMPWRHHVTYPFHCSAPCDADVLWHGGNESQQLELRLGLASPR